MPAPAPITHLAENIKDHISEVDFLWLRRQDIILSPAMTVGAFLEHEERLTAHLDALCETSDTATPALLKALDSQEFFDAFAPTYCLLRINHDGTAAKIVTTFAKGEDADALEVCTKAICHAAARPIVETLATAPTLSDIAFLRLAEVTAFCDAPASRKMDARLATLLRHDDTALRQRAWRVALLNASGLTPELGLAGVLDEDAAVRQLALETVAWNAQSWLLDHCHRAAEKFTPDKLAELKMLAILAAPTAPEDAARILALADNAALGPERFALLGTLGQPECVEILLRGMDSTNPREALAAGDAFSRITGCTVRIDRRVTLMPADGHEPDEFEKEFLDEAGIPDAEDAARQWREIKNNFQPGHRYSGGTDITETPADWSEVDMASRWEINLRNAYHGKPHLRPADLERFPCQLVPSHTAKPTAPKPKTYLVGISD